MNLAELEQAAATALARGQYQQSHRYCLEILKREPGHPEAHYWLGINCLSRRLPDKAITLLQVATRLAPGEGRYWVQLARALSLAERVPETEAALARALACEPGDALSIDSLGVLFSRLGDHARAEGYFRRSLEREPTNPDFLFNLAASLRFNGKLAEAAEVSRKLYRLHPERTDNYALLAELAPESTLAELAGAFRQRLRELTEVDARLQVAHGLARLLERQEQPVAALEVLLEPNAARRAAIEYDPAEDGAMFDALHRVCDHDFLAGLAVEPVAAPIFVVGMPRTGTTLLERIIAAHSQVSSAGELQDFPVLFKRASGSASPRLLDAATVAAAGAVDYPALGRQFLQVTRPRAGDTVHFIDKLPMNFLYTAFILKAIPGARVICLRRHPLDTVVSNFRQLFALRASQYRYAHDLADIARYYLEFDRLVGHWSEVLPPGQFLQIAYEDLVADTERHSRRVIEFLRLPWEPACLDFHASTAPVATASALQVRRPVYRSSVGRWRVVAELLKPARQVFEAAGLQW